MIDIYVINLKERTDRYQQIINDFKPFPNINLIFIEAIKRENGAIGCSLSHKKCVQFAKNNHLPYIIVVEDDCLPMDNFESRLSLLLDFLNHNQKWSLFLGGVKKTNRILFKAPYDPLPIFTIKNGHCTHLTIYNSNIYDDVLLFNENTDRIDTFWHSKFIAHITLPFLAYQRNGFSDIGNVYNNSFISSLNHTQTVLTNFVSQNNIL